MPSVKEHNIRWSEKVINWKNYKQMKSYNCDDKTAEHAGIFG